MTTMQQAQEAISSGSAMSTTALMKQLDIPAAPAGEGSGGLSPATGTTPQRAVSLG